jgi:hypothetical protein
MGAMNEVRRGFILRSFLSFLVFVFNFAFVLTARAQDSDASVARARAPGERLPGDAWAPPDVDARVPPVASGVICPLPTVVAGAGKAVQELVRNLDRFTATEIVQHYSVNGGGKLGKPQNRRFDYVVSISPVSPGAPGGPRRNGYLSVREYRSRAPQPEQFPDGVATEGTPSLMRVFHPLYTQDFDMLCEGLGTWKGQAAWQVRFEQRRDRPNHMSNVVVRGRMYNIRLRGRAWILQDSYQLARMEMDLAEPIPPIRLRLQHMVVEYGPVKFPERRTELWLPTSAELYMDFIGRRFYRKHSFSGFTLFSVDVNEEFRPIGSTSP